MAADPDVTDSEPFNPAHSRAVLFGVEKYPTLNRTVPAAIRNIHALGEALRDPAVFGMIRAAVDVVDDPKKGDFTDYVSDAARAVEKNGLLIIYFVGHAEKADGRVALLASGETSQPNLRVDVADLAEATKGTRARSVVLILDCCFGGRAVFSLPQTIQLVGAPLTGWQLLAAAGNEEASDAEEDEKHTPFTQALLQVLQTGMPQLPAAKYLTPLDLLRGIDDLYHGEVLLPKPAGSAPVITRGWIQNRAYQPPAPRPRLYTPPLGKQARVDAWPGTRWPDRPKSFVGRRTEIDRARKALADNSGLLPVVGPFRSGKTYFVQQVLGTVYSPDPPTDLCLVELDVANRTAPDPVLQELARVSGLELDTEAEDLQIERPEALRQKIVDRLRANVGQRRLLLWIKGARLGSDPARICRSVDWLFTYPFFSKALVILSTRVDTGLERAAEVDVLPTMRIAQLDREEATELLRRRLGDLDQGLAVHADGSIWEAVPDDLARLPGNIVNGAFEFVSMCWAKPFSPSPEDDLSRAILRRCVPAVVQVLSGSAADRLWASSDADEPGALAVLIAWAVTDGLVLSEGHLGNLSPDFRGGLVGRLTQSLLLSKEDGGYFTLGSITRRALKEFALPSSSVRHPLVAESEQLDAALARVFAVIVPLLLRDPAVREENVESQVMHGVQRALGWIEEEGHSLPRLRAVLNTLLAGHLGDALMHPIGGEAELVSLPGLSDVVAPTEIPTIHHGDGIFAVVVASARLNHVVRGRGGTAEIIGRDFADTAYRMSIALIRCRTVDLTHRLLKSIDTSLFIGSLRLDVSADLLEVRARTHETLVSAANSREHPDLLSVAVSWLLNTAGLQLEAGQRVQAREQVAQARRLIDERPRSDSRRDRLIQLQLQQRVLRMEARCVGSTAERIALLGQAVECTYEGMYLSLPDSQGSLWNVRLLGVTELLIGELPTLAEQRDTLDGLHNAMVEFWRSQIPEDLLVKLWYLAHTVYRAVPDPVQRLEDANRALNWLSSISLPGPRAEAHMFVAHSLRNAGQHQKGVIQGETALDLARDAARSDMRPKNLLRELRITRVVEQWRQFAPATDDTSPLPRTTFASRLKQVRRHLRRVEVIDRSHAFLDLWCLRQKWSDEGSLLAAVTDPATAWQQSNKDRLGEARRLYDIRRSMLDGHENRYGYSTILLRMRVALERQYQRTVSVLDRITQGDKVVRPNVNNEPVFLLLRQGRERSHDHPDVLDIEADFQRYIWDFLKAVDLYRVLIARACTGPERLMATLAFAESAASYAQFGYPRSETVVTELLGEAHQRLGAEAREGPLFEQTVLLQARLALEMGLPVDWGAIERVGQDVLKGGYAAGVSSWLNVRHQPGSRASGILHPDNWKVSSDSELGRQVIDQLSSVPTTLATSSLNEESATADLDGSVTLGDLLRENFTELHLLHGLGCLYLRRAEKDRQIEHARLAYDLFDGCRVVQQAERNRRTTCVTTFLLGRAILLAAEIAQSADPFDAPSPRTDRSWLGFAEGLFHSAKENSVGLFGAGCSHYQRVTRALQTTLSERDRPPLVIPKPGPPRPRTS